MNTKDLKDIGEAIYYLAAVEADLEGLGINVEFRGPEDVRVQMIKNLKQACTAIDTVALGTNRKPGVFAVDQGKEHAEFRALLVEWEGGLYDGLDFLRRVRLALHGHRGLSAVKP